MKSPVGRLVGRAIVAGLLSFLALLQASDSWDWSVVRAGLVGAVLAAVEVLTPLNATVGVNKP